MITFPTGVKGESKQGTTQETKENTEEGFAEQDFWQKELRNTGETRYYIYKQMKSKLQVQGKCGLMEQQHKLELTTDVQHQSPMTQEISLES